MLRPSLHDERPGIETGRLKLGRLADGLGARPSVVTMAWICPCLTVVSALVMYDGPRSACIATDPFGFAPLIQRLQGPTQDFHRHPRRWPVRDISAPTKPGLDLGKYAMLRHQYGSSHSTGMA